MFTGIVQQKGRIAAVERGAKDGRLRVSAPGWSRPLEIGESIAVNGCCLTLTAEQQGVLSFDLLNETFVRTTLGEKKPGQHVNLERSLCVGDAMGGHFVTGHVDAVGRVQDITGVGRDWILRIACGAELLGGMVPKGSVALDGVSLTIVDLEARGFSVHLIPHTWNVTALCELRRGDGVNLETDMLGKYVRRILEAGTAAGGITWDKLREHGFT